MKLTLDWLSDHLEFDAPVEVVAERLTAIGHEVEGIDRPGEALGAFRIARVLTAEPHPDADKLRVLSVDAGDGLVTVVCGAPNARAGMVGVFGPPGAVVPANGMALRVAAIRGVESHGMMCSATELGTGTEGDGILELADDAPVGESYAEVAGLAHEVIDVAITPDRGDCMGVRGLARDLAAAGLGILKPLAVPAFTGTAPGPDVRTETPACPAFFATAVSGVTNGPSPDWLRRRLLSVGQKPISALVDITNYVMLDLGRPLHVYDRATLSGPLVARAAAGGEVVEALNGRSYTLAAGMTVIADNAGVHDIAGIMGGAASGAQPGTTDVLIECAYFEPDAVARTGQALALTSDARTRFERGVDPAALDDGLAIATELVVRLCGGSPSAPTRAGHPPVPDAATDYDPALCETLGGLAVAPERQRAILEALGFSVEIRGEMFHVEHPAWRRDVDGPADLVEEVLRIVGYDRVPATPLPRPDGVARPTATPVQRRERRLRRAAAALGLTEAITWSFLSDVEAEPFGGAAHRLANPISREMVAMRPSLIPGLLSAAGRNRDRGADPVRLFEIGRRYTAEGEGDTLAVLLAGEAAPRDWRTGKAAGFEAHDAKALAEALLAEAGAPVDKLMVMGEAGDAFHPGRSATLGLGPKTVLARLGALHPAVLAAFDLDGPVVAAELFLDALPVPKSAERRRPPFTPSALQPVVRDFAFLVSDTLPAADLVRAVRGAEKARITGARIFDRFAGEGVPDGRVSLAVEVTLQPDAKSFTEEELAALSERIVAAAGKVGAELRG